MERPSFSIYDASAGSGKTYTLVKEYLKILLVDSKKDAYRNILAITFTNKAVHEMKSRIISNLFDFSQDILNEKAIYLAKVIGIETGLSTAEITSKSKEIIRHIIHNYAAFDILTIDKFTYKLIRAFAIDLDLPISFEVSLDTDSLLIEAVDSLIDAVGEEDLLTQLLIDFTLEKTDNDYSWDISREIIEAGQLLFKENNRIEIEHLHNKSISDFLEIKGKLDCETISLANQNSAFAQEIIELLEINVIDLSSFSRGTFPNHLLSIKGNKFNPNNKTFRTVEDVLINKSALDKDKIEALLPEIVGILEIIYRNYDKQAFYLLFLRSITPLSLLNRLTSEVSRIQEEQNILSIAQFNAIINSQIQNQPAPFIYERLGERYRHFFIDEFQDTSELQWQNLIPLIDNALSSKDESGQKGTLLIVGDPKQSIYRWRGGKAEQFIALSKNENPFSNPDKQIFHLTVNYRSYDEIINFNNSFFNFLSNEFENEDYKDLYENHSSQNSNDKKGGYINISFLTEKEVLDPELNDEEIDSNNQYCKKTFEIIRQCIHQGFKNKEITILTRKKSQGVLVANYLIKEGIPIQSSETLLLQHATEVQFLIAVLRFLNAEADKESKANLLVYLGKNKQNKLALADFIYQGLQTSNEELFETWLCKFDISINFSDLRKKPLFVAVESVVMRLITPKNNHAYVQYFLDIVLEKSQQKQFGVSEFLNFWDKNGSKYSIPTPEGNDAIKIMTIHKSKGLEFPIVIFPFADENYGRKPKDTIWIETEEDDFGLDKVLLSNSKVVSNYSENAFNKYNNQKQEELLDNINILYVALTRAEEQLYIISQFIKPNKEGVYPNSMASLFIRYLHKKLLFEDNKREYKLGIAMKLSKIETATSTIQKIKNVGARFDTNNIKIAQKEALLWGTHQQNAIAYGNIIHEILSNIHSEKNVETALNKAMESGLILQNQHEIISESIYSIVSNKELLDYFSEENQVLNERMIIQKMTESIKPDRIVLTPTNEVFLLDYKTGIYDLKHKLQLEKYQNYIEQMNFKVTKKALVYIGNTIEVIHL